MVVLRDDHFIHNLHRIAGRTDCITPDTVLEVLVYVHNENFVELLEFEQNYTGDIFNDAALDLEVCSIEVSVGDSRHNNKLLI